MKTMIATDDRRGAVERTVELGGYVAPGVRERITLDVEVSCDATRKQERGEAASAAAMVRRSPISWREVVAMRVALVVEPAGPSAVLSAMDPQAIY